MHYWAAGPANLIIAVVAQVAMQSICRLRLQERKINPLKCITNSFEQISEMELSFSPDDKKGGGGGRGGGAGHRGFVSTVKRDVGIGLRGADRAINSGPGKVALGVAGNVPGPVGEPAVKLFLNCV